jgi:hypothetical protein
MHFCTSTMDDAALIKHSFDLVHFPMYLKRHVAPCVSIEWCNSVIGADVVGYYTDTEQVRTSRYIKLVDDPNGVATGTDQFFNVVHGAFQSMSTPLCKYIGFARCGPPVFAPLFALTMLYKKYGMGWYPPGEVLPTPCDFLTFGYEMHLR